jgi:hypothetical protein
MKKFFALMPKNNKECMVEWSTSNRMYGRMEQQFESEIFTESNCQSFSSIISFD